MSEKVVQQTSMGTPAGRTWDDEWLAKVDAMEQGWGRRLCGAKTPAGTPCTLRSQHANGRCPHHGGHDLIGAPNGNQNARVHGMYSRRITTCGDHCPMWRSCPFAKKAILKVPAAERPKCVYEQSEFDMLTENLDPDDAQFHLNHMIALVQVMASRAAHALSIRTGVSYSGPHDIPRMSPIQQAFFRLVREHQRYVALKYRTRDEMLQQGVRERMYGEKVRGYWAAVEAERIDDHAKAQGLADDRAEAQRRKEEEEGDEVQLLGEGLCEVQLRNEGKVEGIARAGVGEEGWVDRAGGSGASGAGAFPNGNLGTRDLGTRDLGTRDTEVDESVGDVEMVDADGGAGVDEHGPTRTCTDGHGQTGDCAVDGEGALDFDSPAVKASIMEMASIRAAAEAEKVMRLVEACEHGERRGAVLRE